MCSLIFGGPLQYLYETYGPDWMRTKPATLPEDAELVDLSIRISDQLSMGVFSTAVPVYVYDANMVFIESANSDTTTGVSTFQSDYWEGETLNIQAYVAPVAAGAHAYSTPVTEFVVPQGDVNGDAQLANWYLYQPTSGVATFGVTDQGSAAISGTAINYLNASVDASIRVTIVCTTADDAYGTPEDWTDMKTGYKYLGGVFIVLKFNETQDMQAYDWFVEEGSYFYYIYRASMIINDSEIYTDGALTVTIATGSTFTGGAGHASIVIDVFDSMKLNSAGGIDSNSWKNYNSSNNPSAVTSVVR
jgi:hypothetical protein